MFRLGLLLVSYVFNDLCCAPVCPLVTFCPLFAKYIYIFNTPVIYVYTFCPQEENLLSFSPWDYKKKIFLSFSLWDHEKKIFLSFSPWDHEIIYLTTWCSWWNLPVLELHVLFLALSNWNLFSSAWLGCSLLSFFFLIPLIKTPERVM